MAAHGGIIFKTVQCTISDVKKTGMIMIWSLQFDREGPYYKNIKYTKLLVCFENTHFCWEVVSVHVCLLLDVTHRGRFLLFSLSVNIAAARMKHICSFHPYDMFLQQSNTLHCNIENGCCQWVYLYPLLIYIFLPFLTIGDLHLAKPCLVLSFWMYFLSMKKHCSVNKGRSSSFFENLAINNFMPSTSLISNTTWIKKFEPQLQMYNFILTKLCKGASKTDPIKVFSTWPCWQVKEQHISDTWSVFNSRDESFSS